MDVLHVSKKADGLEKLGVISKEVSSLIKKYRPHEVAVEAPFYAKNPQSMLKLGRAQGVAIAAALIAGLPVFEYSPRKVKQSVTGNGNATKEQVANLLSRILDFKELPEYFDATDAVAVAVCHFFQNGKSKSGEKKYSGWDQFIKSNPDRKFRL